LAPLRKHSDVESVQVNLNRSQPEIPLSHTWPSPVPRIIRDYYYEGSLWEQVVKENEAGNHLTQVQLENGY